MHPLPTNAEIVTPLLVALCAAVLCACHGRRYRRPAERGVEAFSAFAWTAAAVALSEAWHPGSRQALATLLAAALCGHEAVRRGWVVTERLRGTIGRYRITGVGVSLPDGRVFPAGLYYEESTGRWAQPGDVVSIEIRRSWLFGSVLGTRLTP